MRQAVRGGLIRERAVAVVDEQLVPALLVQKSHVGHIYVEQPVAVHIRHGNPFRPIPFARYACLIGHVFEPEIAPVQVQSVGQRTRREIQIDETVSVHIARSHAAAIVVIQIIENVERRIRRQIVAEPDARILRRKPLEKRIPGTARKQHGKDDRDPCAGNPSGCTSMHKRSYEYRRAHQRTEITCTGPSFTAIAMRRSATRAMSRACPGTRKPLSAIGTGANAPRAVAPKKQAVPRVHPSDFGLGSIKITGHEEVLVPVLIVISGK